MPQYVAFLRGINVGGHRIRMDDLRGIFRGMGFSEVDTFIASGNVIFSASSGDATQLRRRIEKGLAEALGYEVATFLRTRDDLEVIAGAEAAPIEGEGGKGPNVHVVFLAEDLGTELRGRLAAMETERDRFTFGAREVFWTTRGRMSESPVFRGGLERARADLTMTVRSLSTVRRLLAKLERRE